MYKVIHHIDLFGIDQKLSLQSLNYNQKSVAGGLTTLVLYGLSLAYFIVQLIDWQENNKLPKYTSLKTQVSENETIQSQLVFAEISQVLQNSYGQIDLFDPNNLVLFPQIIQTSSDGNDIKLIDSEFKEEIQEDGTILHKLLIQNVTLIAQPQITLEKKAQEYYLLLQFCDSNFISQNPQLKCANKELIQQYKEQQGLRLKIIIFLEIKVCFDKKFINNSSKLFSSIINIIIDFYIFYNHCLNLNNFFSEPHHNSDLLQNQFKNIYYVLQISHIYSTGFLKCILKLITLLLLFNIFLLMNRLKEQQFQ